MHWAWLAQTPSQSPCSDWSVCPVKPCMRLAMASAVVFFISVPKKTPLAAISIALPYFDESPPSRMIKMSDANLRKCSRCSPESGLPGNVAPQRVPDERIRPNKALSRQSAVRLLGTRNYFRIRMRHFKRNSESELPNQIRPEGRKPARGGLGGVSAVECNWLQGQVAHLAVQR